MLFRSQLKASLQPEALRVHQQMHVLLYSRTKVSLPYSNGSTTSLCSAHHDLPLQLLPTRFHTHMTLILSSASPIHLAFRGIPSPRKGKTSPAPSATSVSTGILRVTRSLSPQRNAFELLKNLIPSLISLHFCHIVNVPHFTALYSTSPSSYKTDDLFL